MWLRQKAQLEQEIIAIDVKMTENSAEIKRTEDYLASLNNIQTTYVNERQNKVDQVDKIDTALYYLNKALWTDEESIQSE